MFNLRLITVYPLLIALVVMLAACAGQPPSSEPGTPVMDDSAKTTQPAATASEDKTSTVVKPEAKEPESPTIETIPRQELEQPTVELEPLKPMEPVVSPEPEEAAPVVEEKEVAETEVAKTEVADTKAADMEQQAEPAMTQQPADQAMETAPAKVQEQPEPAAPPTPAPVEKPQAPVAAAPAPAMPTDPNTFVITVGPKAAPHPALGKGHSLGFLVNGVSGKQLVLERGKTYTFDIQTDPKHDVYLSRKEIGWGASPLTEGVTGAYTYKGTMTFTPTESTPDEVYYSCRNHPHMGALIQIINPGEKVNIAVQGSGSGAASAAPSTPATNVTQAAVKQKLMFAEMMVNSQGAKRVSESQNDEAKQLLEKAKAALSEGREKSLVGALPDALAKADESLQLMSEATRLVPSQEAMAQLAENYKSLLAEITDYQKSHKDNLERMQRSGTVPEEVRYDEAKIANMMAEAKVNADKNNYVRANSLLTEVQKTITVALHKMLDSQTIVYDLNFETAKDEYEYELKRFVSYEELIPIAIEAKKPAPGAVKLMESFVEKARKRRDQAVEKANAGEYPDAIAMLQQATTTVRRALRMVGVMQ
ncbi:hypothetical protein [Kaarinaea lacus]